MSLYAIKEYRNEVEKIIHYGGTKKGTAIRNAFYVLLNKYADSKDLRLVPEISLKTKAGKIVTPDGTLKDILRLLSFPSLTVWILCAADSEKL